MKRGVATIDHLRERSKVDPTTRCWHWDGAKIKGHARIWTLDLDRGEKGVMSGARAVWYIAHGQALRGFTAWMGCWTADCVCPVHVRRGTRAEMNAAMGRAGVLASSTTDKRRAAAQARAAAGITDTPDAVVREVLAAAGTVTNKALGLRLGVAPQIVGRIINGRSFARLQGETTCAP